MQIYVSQCLICIDASIEKDGFLTGGLMDLLYSNILPMKLQEGNKTIADVFYELIEKSDRVEIAVGYVSKASLIELDDLVEQNKKKER